MKRLISTTLEEITTTSESCITVADTVDLSRPLPAVAAQLSPVNGTQSPVFPGSYRTLDSTITDCYSFLERHPVDRLRPSSLPEVPEEAARLVIDGALRLVEPRNIGNILLRNFEDEYDVTVSMEEQFPAVMDSYARFIGRIPSLGEELRHASYERLQPFVQSVELYHFSITSNHPSLLSFFELLGLDFARLIFELLCSSPSGALAFFSLSTMSAFAPLVFFIYRRTEMTVRQLHRVLRRALTVVISSLSRDSRFARMRQLGLSANELYAARIRAVFSASQRLGASLSWFEFFQQRHRFFVGLGLTISTFGGLAFFSRTVAGRQYFRSLAHSTAFGLPTVLNTNVSREPQRFVSIIGKIVSFFSDLEFVKLFKK